MIAATLPQIARQPKPERLRPRFAQVGTGQLSTIPGKKGWPLLGVLPEAVKNPFEFARTMYETYGPVHRFYACGNWNVQLIGPEANEFVLFDRDGNFSAYGGWKPVFGRHFDGGLLLRDGIDHQWHRKLLASAFKQDQLQRYLDIFSATASRFCSIWSGHTVNSYELAQSLTFANGYSAFLGLNPVTASRRHLLAFRHLMRSAAAVIPVPLPGNAHWRAKWAKRQVRQLILPMLDTEPAEGRTDLAAVLIRMKKEQLLADDEIVDHLTFTIAASFDALSSATVSTLYYLARHPEWQRRVREELCSRLASPSRIDVTALQQCEQSEWAVKEALRLNAAAPVLWRRAIKDTQFAGYDIPAGTVTGVNPMLTHLLPDVWDRPCDYDPDRFGPEPTRARHRYAFVPFGGGAHGCLGANFALLQVRAFLRHLLEHHELVLTSAQPPQWYHWPNCRPLDGLPIELRRLPRV